MTQFDSGVRVEVMPPLLTLLLDAPERHNALTEAGIEAALNGIDAGLSESIRVVVVRGSGEETFCSGAFLEEIESGALTPERFEAFTDAIAAIPVPTVAALNGSVYGGGADLALACDFRMGITGTRLHVPAAQLGLCYPMGGIRRFVTRLGPATAKRILVVGEILESDELHRVGYFTHLADPDSWSDAVEGLVDRIAAAAPLAVKSMKALVDDVATGSVDPERTAALIARCRTSSDLIEGLAAWKEGRRPDFTGS